MENVQRAEPSEGLSIRQLAPLFSKQRDRLGGLTQQVLVCWAYFTPVTGGMGTGGREGLREKRKE